MIIVFPCDRRLSVLQLATDNSVYLLDVLTLSKLLVDDDWRHLVEKVFCIESISVVGKFHLLPLCGESIIGAVCNSIIGHRLDLFTKCSV